MALEKGKKKEKSGWGKIADAASKFVGAALGLGGGKNEQGKGTEDDEEEEEMEVDDDKPGQTDNEDYIETYWKAIVDNRKDNEISVRFVLCSLKFIYFMP